MAPFSGRHETKGKFTIQKFATTIIGHNKKGNTILKITLSKSQS